ncbi:MAG: phage tail sheath family protein [Bacteroidetes bacterium]|nr:phage tail sheath family protein [Bacteroidota bacterium]
MATYKTPGVYVEEISTLGSSVAGVPTAITGFAGYTEKATLLDGTPATMTPVRITSLLEYQQIFGGAFHETFTVTLTGAVSGGTIATAPTSVITDVGPPIVRALSSYILFYQVQMFYANGGGTCYITSVGDYTATISETTLNAGIDLFEQIDEITLLCAPETVFLTDTGKRKVVYDNMAVQCAKLQDRFAVLDVVHNGNNTIYDDAGDFRDSDIGANNLKYVGAYYPALNTPIGYFYNDADVKIVDNRPFLGTGPYSLAPNNTLSAIKTTSVGTLVQASRSFTITGLPATPFGPSDLFEIKITTGVDQVFTPNASPGPGNYNPGLTLADSLNHLIIAINTDPAISQFVTASLDSLITPTILTITANLSGSIGNSYKCIIPAGSLRFGAGTPGTVSLINGAGSPADLALYNRITAELAKYTLTLYPAAAMTGVYAQVDAARGVWKAPANVGLSLVNKPSITITDEDQENLNVDSTSGKSINAIRTFTGRGTLVWGARTLAGNDNEWRYINVRRLFIYVEESIKKATEFVVFESNTATTWQRVKGMSEAFLTSVWRDGGLAGATTKDAYFVNVGLGTTMTAQDILEGRMIVEIGMAAVRPAEFIILRFEHKLQES